MHKKPTLREIIKDDPKFIPSVVIGVIVAIEIAVLLGLIIAHRLN